VDQSRVTASGPGDCELSPGLCVPTADTVASSMARGDVAICAPGTCPHSPKATTQDESAAALLGGKGGKRRLVALTTANEGRSHSRVGKDLGVRTAWAVSSTTRGRAVPLPLPWLSLRADLVLPYHTQALGSSQPSACCRFSTCPPCRVTVRLIPPVAPAATTPQIGVRCAVYARASGETRSSAARLPRIEVATPRHLANLREVQAKERLYSSCLSCRPVAGTWTRPSRLVAFCRGWREINVHVGSR